MTLDRYPIVSGESGMVYEFTSTGKKGMIKKLVVFSKTNVKGVYNLGFGDKDELTGDINDLTITNNGDSQKVLATVASTIYSFTDIYTDAYIFATGSTKARNRLYRIGIANNYSLIQKDFEVFGLQGEKWHPFDKSLEFDAFLVKRKKK